MQKQLEDFPSDIENFSMSLKIKDPSNFFKLKRIIKEYFTTLPDISCTISKGFAFYKINKKGCINHIYFVKFQISFNKLESVNIILTNSKITFESNLFNSIDHLVFIKTVKGIIKWIEDQIYFYVIKKVFEC